MSWLSLSNLVVLGLVYVCWKILWQIVHYHYFHPLSIFPGPFWGGVTRLWLAYHNLKADECQIIQALHRKHGEHRSVRSFENCCNCTESASLQLCPTVM